MVAIKARLKLAPVGFQLWIAFAVNLLHLKGFEFFLTIRFHKLEKNDAEIVAQR